MKGKLLTFLALAGLFSAGPAAADKKALDHDDFDAWKSVRNMAVSRSGEWAAFAVNPQEGDGILTFYNTRSRKRVEIPRGYDARISADGRWGVALIKAPFADTRKAKIDKKKDSELPQDSPRHRRPEDHAGHQDRRCHGL